MLNRAINTKAMQIFFQATHATASRPTILKSDICVRLLTEKKLPKHKVTEF